MTDAPKPPIFPANYAPEYINHRGYPDSVTVTIKATMRARWLPHFLSMLQHMAKLGSWGSSRMVHFYADGDGDFRPRFEWDLPVNLAEPVQSKDGENTYDAG
jgi:hypothetical protein